MLYQQYVASVVNRFPEHTGSDVYDLMCTVSMEMWNAICSVDGFFGVLFRARSIHLTSVGGYHGFSLKTWGRLSTDLSIFADLFFFPYTNREVCIIIFSRRFGDKCLSCPNSHTHNWGLLQVDHDHDRSDPYTQ